MLTMTLIIPLSVLLIAEGIAVAVLAIIITRTYYMRSVKKRILCLSSRIQMQKMQMSSILENQEKKDVEDLKKIRRIACRLANLHDIFFRQIPYVWYDFYVAIRNSDNPVKLFRESRSSIRKLPRLSTKHRDLLAEAFVLLNGKEGVGADDMTEGQYRMILDWAS